MKIRGTEDLNRLIFYIIIFWLVFNLWRFQLLMQYICIGIICAEQRLRPKILNLVWKTPMRVW